VHFGTREIQFFGQHGYGRGRDESQLRLNTVEDFDQCAGTSTVGRDDAEHGITLSWGKGLLHLGRER
jgi:hypothetical protein